MGPSWGSFWAPIWPPGMLKPISSVASGRPRAVPYNIFSAQDRPSTSQDASRTAPSAPKVPPRLSKSLQDGSVSLQELSRRGFLRAQAVSKSSLEELPKPPTFAVPPLASEACRWFRREARSVNSPLQRRVRLPASYLVNLLSSSNLRFLGPKILDLRCI